MFYNQQVKTGTRAAENRIVNRILSRLNQIFARLDGGNRPEPAADWDFSSGIVVYEDEVVCWEDEVVWIYP